MAVTFITAWDFVGGERYHRIEVDMTASGDVATVKVPVPRNYCVPISIQAVYGSGTSLIAVASTLANFDQLCLGDYYNPSGQVSSLDRIANQTAVTNATNIPAPQIGPTCSPVQLVQGVALTGNNTGWNNGTGLITPTTGVAGGAIVLDPTNIPWSSLPGGVSAIADGTTIQVEWPIKALRFTTTGGGGRIIILCP